MSSTGDKADPEAIPATEGEPVDNPEANDAQESKPLDPDMQVVLLALQAVRYEDMADGMKAYVAKTDKLEGHEIDLLDHAYKNVIEERRKAWHKIDALIEPNLPQREEKKAEAIAFREKLGKELQEWAEKGVTLLDTLIPKSKIPKAKVYFMKDKADYYRYIAEIISEDERNTYLDKGLQAYKEAYEFSKSNLHKANPVHLTVAINFSVFYKTILKALDKGTEILKEALDLGSPELVTLDDNEKDSAVGYFNKMRLMYNRWSKEMGKNDIYQERSETDSSDKDNMQEDKQETKDN